MKFSKTKAYKNKDEKILLFGTGVLLRGLCDYIFFELNQKEKFSGTTVHIKSLAGGIEAFKNQDSIFTHFLTGVENGKVIQSKIVNEVISRVQDANSEWDEILETAAKSSIELIISNSTESGLVYEKEDILSPQPKSYPAKLTACLYYRYKKGMDGLVIIATELLKNNGELTKNIVLQHVQDNKLESGFKKWLNQEVFFCNSLVDRIVPGKAPKSLLDTLDYQDELAIVSENYGLWAIEAEKKVKKRLAWLNEDPLTIVKNDINKYWDLKLFLLNAPHTLMASMAYLSGFETVLDLMSDELMEKYITILILTELAPSVPSSIDTKTSQRYGRQVLDRFRNPNIDHKWITITTNNGLKMKSRAIPLLFNYYEVFESVPHYFARCFAAFILFMKVEKEDDGKYYGVSNGNLYEIKCITTPEFQKAWSKKEPKLVVNEVLKNKKLWDKDLSKLPGFEEIVTTHLSNMLVLGVKDVAAALNVFA